MNFLFTFLKSWHPVDQLSLKQLTIKTLASIAITTSDSGQTLHSINTKQMLMSDASISFFITNKLETTKRVLKPKICQFLQPSLVCLYQC